MVAADRGWNGTIATPLDSIDSTTTAVCELLDDALNNIAPATAYTVASCSTWHTINWQGRKLVIGQPPSKGGPRKALEGAGPVRLVIDEFATWPPHIN